MQPSLIAFYSLAIVTAASALGILWVKNVLHGALLLILCVLSIAGIFALMNAEFLAVTQIMIYAGGVLVLLLFGIMITARMTGALPQVGTSHRWLGLAVGISVVALIVTCLDRTLFLWSFKSDNNKASAIGIKLVTDFVAPFELSGVLLLASLISALVAATYQHKHD